ncbi:unnamed protein product [Paramecium sonneborni]|uniref:Uncharacterized protein n=1 Tax=Paramecium sonneborni TaxID=65129 RepID=A0A8S1QZ07_9CILI|nr:unnamed protein product [Paramecium sonneborni]
MFQKIKSHKKLIWRKLCIETFQKKSKKKNIIQQRIEANIQILQQFTYCKLYQNQCDAYLPLEMYQKSFENDQENKLSLNNLSLAYMKINQTDEVLDKS